MKRSVMCVLAVVFVLCACCPQPAEAGLFGPSKRELMQRMLDQQRESHGVQVLMYGEMKTQTELLRQIAGETSASRAEMRAVGEGLSRFGQVPSNPQSISPAPYPTVPSNPQSISPAPYPTVLPNPQSIAPASNPTVPSGPQSISPAPFPTIESSRRTINFAAQKRAVPIKTVQWTNSNIRR